MNKFTLFVSNYPFCALDFMVLKIFIYQQKLSKVLKPIDIFFEIILEKKLFSSVEINGAESRQKYFAAKYYKVCSYNYMDFAIDSAIDFANPCYHARLVYLWGNHIWYRENLEIVV